jgi:hypothetical protein
MLMLDPNQRITAKEALNHPYFSTEPFPASYEEIEKFMENLN